MAEVDPQYELMQRLDRHLDETLERFDVARRPVWESQAEIGKSLVALASGALVLSISWVQFLVTRVPHPRWSGMLVGAWVLFTLTVLLAASRHGWAGRARMYRLAFEALRGELRAEVAAIDRRGGGSQEIDDEMTRAVEKANDGPRKALRVYNGISHVMFWSFALGIVALVTFALKNLPF